VEAATTTSLSWPFGQGNAPADHERSFRDSLPENDADDQGPAEPPPPPAAPAAPGSVPVVSPGWAEDYKSLWQAMVIRPEWKKAAEAIAQKIVANHGRYSTAVTGTTVPWWFVAVVHAMECSLNFTEHLHNGDPLTARTRQVPEGRPATGNPPFTWEESARDAISYEKLDKVTDWSLPSVLFHWHRYNGINNEYKRRSIPTPYLWSGSQHYVKGKYVADGKFDPDAVSRQVGAAVLLRTLVDLNAVAIDAAQAVVGNPAAATAHVPSLAIDLSGPAFQHVGAELDYPGALASGSGRDDAERRAVRRVQEWLNIHDCTTAIDNGFGDSTAEQLKAFQTKSGREPTGQLDPETWSLLTAPLRRALAAIDHGGSSSLEDAVIRVAQQHIREAPIEIGGNNRGPWVRLYMVGQDGEAQKWCAGFVCFVVAQAARDLGIAIPFRRQAGVDALVEDAKTSRRFIAEADVSDPTERTAKLRPGTIFVVRASATDWTHTGLVLSVASQTFDTLEGNTGGDGGSDGANARKGNRSYPSKDFLSLYERPTPNIS
jgi:lysozyme family protein